MSNRRSHKTAKSDGKIAYGNGMDYSKVDKPKRGVPLEDVIKPFLPDELATHDLPIAPEFFKDPIKNLFIIAAIVRKRLQYAKSYNLPESLNKGVAKATDIWREAIGNCQAFSIVFVSILMHFGVHSRLISLVSQDRSHPPHMVVMVHFPEASMGKGYSKRCTELWRKGVPDLAEPFRCPPRKLRWTHVSADSKAHLEGKSEVGHYLIHPPQQQVGGYYGLFNAAYLAAKSTKVPKKGRAGSPSHKRSNSPSALDAQARSGFKFVRAARVCWQTDGEADGEAADLEDMRREADLEGNQYDSQGPPEEDSDGDRSVISVADSDYQDNANLDDISTMLEEEEAADGAAPQKAKQSCCTFTAKKCTVM